MEAHTETLLDGPLRSILDREPIGVAVYRPEKHGRDFRYVYANPAFEALHPGTPTVGSSYAEVWPLVADTLLRLLTRVLETGQPWTGRDVPIPLETEPGVGVTHRYTLDISRVELGGKHHLLEIARDTTAEFEAGREIEAARDRLEDVLLRMSDGFLALDRDWRCTFVNERALRSLDKTREEVVGRSFWELVPDGASPVLGEQLHKVMDDGETVSFDLFNSATRRWSTVRSNPTSEGIAVFVTDITERKAAEERTAGLLEGERLGRTFSGLLAAASSELGATRTPQDLLPHILRDAGLAMGAVGSAVTMRLPHGWRIAHGFGVHERLVGREFTDQQLPSHLRVLETGAPVVARDVRDAAGPNVRLADELAYRSFVINPLTFRQRVIGTLSFAFAEPTEHFPEIHLDFMARLAYVISASIEAERLFEERTEQAEYAEALNRINDAVHSTLEFDEIMERVVVETAKALDVDATAVHMHREGHWEFTYSHGLPEGLRRTRLADADSRLSMRVMRTREPLGVERRPARREGQRPAHGALRHNVARRGAPDRSRRGHRRAVLRLSRFLAGVHGDAGRLHREGRRDTRARPGERQALLGREGHRGPAAGVAARAARPHPRDRVRPLVPLGDGDGTRGRRLLRRLPDRGAADRDHGGRRGGQGARRGGAHLAGQERRARARHGDAQGARKGARPHQRGRVPRDEQRVVRHRVLRHPRLPDGHR